MSMMHDFKEKLDRYATLWTTLVTIPIVGGWIKKIGEKAEKKVEQKVGEVLKIEVKEAGEGFGDEILFREALRQLEDPEQEKVEKFRLWLRKNHPEEADALVLGVAKAVKAFEKQIKKTHSSGGGKSGRPLDKTEYAIMEYDHSWSKSFFRRLILRETPEAKMEFVFVAENFQSLIPPEKKPSSFLENARKSLGMTEEAAEKASEHITKALARFNEKHNQRPSRSFWRAAISFRRR